MPPQPIAVAGVAVALTLGLAACGSSNSSSVPATGAAESAATASTQAPPPGAPSATEAPAGTNSPAPSSGSAAGSAAPSADSSGAAGGGDGTSAASGSGRVPLLAPGSYDYTVKGEATSALGKQQIDGTSTLQVDQPQRHRQHTSQHDDQGSTEQVLVAATDGLRLAETHLSMSGFDETFRANSPVLLLPADPHQGDRWHWRMHSTDGKYTLAGSLEVSDLHSSATTASGERRQTLTISAVLTLTGNQLNMTIHQTDDASRDGVIVHEHAVTDGTAYGTKFHSDITRRLSSEP